MRARLATAALLGVAAFGATAPADAACAGTARTVVICVTVNDEALPTVNPTGGSHTDCVYVGSKCYTVTVPIPTVTPGYGDVLTIQCGGDIGQDIFRCNSPV